MDPRFQQEMLSAGSMDLVNTGQLAFKSRMLDPTQAWLFLVFLPASMLCGVYACIPAFASEYTNIYINRETYVVE